MTATSRLAAKALAVGGLVLSLPRPAFAHAGPEEVGWLVGAGVFLLILALVIYTIRVRKLLQRERELSALVSLRTRELAAANERLEELSLVDSVTGVANRRHFDGFLEKEWRRAIREHSFLSIFSVDIDCWRPFAEAYGHPDSDECLRKISGILVRTAKRPGDLVARYGEGEFAMVLYGADPSHARRLADAMRVDVATLRIPHKDSMAGPYVSISVGVATTIPTLDAQPEQLVGVADQQLHDARNNGRNQVRATTLGYASVGGNA